MALSAPGIGSNLDVNGLVSQLMAFERKPLATVQAREAAVQAQLSAYGLLQSQVASFGDAAAALGKAGRLLAFTAAVSDIEVAGVTASSNAVAGTYSLEVKQLAKTEKLATAAFGNAASVIGSGTLTISLGTYDSLGNSFTPRVDKVPLTITLDSGNNTLFSQDFNVSGNSSGWNGSVAASTFERQFQRLGWRDQYQWQV